MSFSAKFIKSIHEIDAQQWNNITGKSYPFLLHEYLAALEDTDCTNYQSGWQVNHLTIYNDKNELIALMPCYLKHHSYGEYVFDWSWANAYERAGLDYYPKLLTAIPYTPCTGPRICIAKNQDEAEIFGFISHTVQEYCIENNLSSAHILFTTDQENSKFSHLKNWQQRLGVQFHWHNRNYQNFDDFLNNLASRKRKNLRKERQQVLDENIEIRCLKGSEITEEIWDRFYHCYQLTYAKRSGHGGYLSSSFFKALTKKLPDNVLLVTAWIKIDTNNKLHNQLALLDQDATDSVMIASSLFIIGEDTLFGRYWGALQEIPGLHFECCYYQGIEYCIKHGLNKIDAGAQGEHKIQRGFEPLTTYSWHYITKADFAEAIEDFLQHERQEMKMYLKQTQELSPFKLQDKTSNS